MNHNTQALQPNPNMPSVDLRSSSLPASRKISAPTNLSLGAIGLGLLAGIVGVASMSLPEKSIRPLIKNEKSKSVPTVKMEKLFRKSEKLGSGGWILNHAIHWGQGAFAKVLTPSLSQSRFRGAIPSFLFTGIRLSTDQILENLFRTGAQKNLSKNEKRIDLFQRAAYAFATGFFADLLFKSRSGPLKNA